MARKPDKQCSVRVFAGTMHGHPCKRSAVVTYHGRRYCCVHHPDFIAAKTKARMQVYKSKLDMERERWRRRAALENIGLGVSTAQIEELGAGWLRGYLDRLKEWR